jgi:hypothetical protein
MVWVIVVMFLVLWALGMVGGAGAYIHVLLVLALGPFFVGLFRDELTPR